MTSLWACPIGTIEDNASSSFARDWTTCNLLNLRKFLLKSLVFPCQNFTWLPTSIVLGRVRKTKLTNIRGVRFFRSFASEMEDYSYLFKIILIGDANVGKTCLVKRFAKGFFAPSQGPTIGVDFTIRTVEVDGERVKVSLYLVFTSSFGMLLKRASCPA